MSLVKRNLVIKITNTQPAFTCLKSTTETPEQGTNHAYRQLYRHQHDANGVALASSLPTQNTPHNTAPVHPLPVKTNIVKLSNCNHGKILYC